MKLRKWLPLTVALLGLAGMGTYAPLLRVERVYVVVPLRYPDSPVVSMRRTDELRGVRTEPAGYGWAWSEPTEHGWFGTKLEYQINWRRLLTEAGLWMTAMALLMASMRPSKLAPEILETHELPSEEHDPDSRGS